MHLWSPVADRELHQWQRKKHCGELAHGEEHIYMAIDEAAVTGAKYINTLVGNVESPEKTFMLHCKQLPD